MQQQEQDRDLNPWCNEASNAAPLLVSEQFVKSQLLIADEGYCGGIYDSYSRRHGGDHQFRSLNVNDVLYPNTNEQQFKSLRQEQILEQEDGLDDSLENIYVLEESKSQSPARLLLPLQMFQNRDNDDHFVSAREPDLRQRQGQDPSGQMIPQQNIQDTPNFRIVERQQRFQPQQEMIHQRVRLEHHQPQIQRYQRYVPPSNHSHNYDIIRRIGEIRGQRYQDFPPPSHNLFQRNHVCRRQPGGLDVNEILMLTEIEFIDHKCRGWEEKDKKCSICLSDFQSKEKVRFLPCLHRFHSNCIDPWLKTNSKCPLCNKNLKKLIQEMNQAYF